jgi:hypothetical protein
MVGSYTPRALRRGQEPVDFDEVVVTVLEPLDKVPDGPGDRRGGRTENTLKTACSRLGGVYGGVNPNRS